MDETYSTFKDRHDAGQRLAERLAHLREADVVVVGLPRGGVPVAHEVAAALEAPLDVILVRKLGVPGHEELAMGAIGEGGVRVLEHNIVDRVGVSPRDIEAVEERERRELARRVERYRGDRDPVALDGRVVVVVDDGVATGSTARAACQVVKARGANRVVLAVPVAPAGWTERLAGVADEYEAVQVPEPFFGVGQFYDDFGQTSDEEVTMHLDAAARELVESG